MKSYCKNRNGFTLVEVIVVIAILGLIVVIAIPRLTGYISMAEERVCAANRKTVEKTYSAFLLENDIDGESAFDQFLIENFKEVCPAGGTISYEEGKVECSLHEDLGDENEDEPPGDEVPWL